MTSNEPHASLFMEESGKSLLPDASYKSRLLADLNASRRIAHFSLISIMQGIAFGYLVRTTTTALEVGSVSLSEAILVFSSLMLIVVVWNDYMRGFVSVIDELNLVDATILFLVGVSECLTIFMIQHSAAAWFYGVGFMSVLGMAASLNLKYKMNHATLGERELLQALINNLRVYKKALSLIFVLSFSLPSLSALVPIGQEIPLAWASPFLVALYIYVDEKSWAGFMKWVKER